MSDDLVGCLHVPDRYQRRLLDSIDTTGRAALTAGISTMRQLIDGTIRAAVISGPVGSGKTHLAAAAANEIGERVWQEHLELDDVRADRNGLTKADRYLDRQCPRWVSVPSLLGSLRRELTGLANNASGTLEEVIGSAGLLVLDDVAAEKSSDWTAQVLLELVASRYDAGLQVIATTNLTPRELVAAGYDRVASRLSDRGAVVSLAGVRDYRTRRTA